MIGRSFHMAKLGLAKWYTMAKGVEFQKEFLLRFCGVKYSLLGMLGTYILAILGSGSY